MSEHNQSQNWVIFYRNHGVHHPPEIVAKNLTKNKAMEYAKESSEYYPKHENKLDISIN